MTTLAPPKSLALPPFEMRGGLLELMQGTQRESLLEGPAGTGKTMGICHWAHLLMLKYPKSRALFVRKTLKSLSASTLVTFQEKTLTQYDPVRFFGGSGSEPASFRYANGSRIVIGGMDNPDKILSTEYDFIYVNEATELSLEDWESLTIRLRNGVMPYPRLVGDANPTHNKHWLLMRCYAGKTRHVKSRVEDNPAYFDEAGEMTEAGRAYIETLDALTGTRYQRFRLGLWVGVENAIYDNFARDRHYGPVRSDLVYVDGAIGVDYGDVHPHAAVAISKTSGGRYVVRETLITKDWDELADGVGRMREQYKIKKVRVDAMLKGWEKPETSPLGLYRVNRADASPGARKGRVELCYVLFKDDAVTIDKTGPGNDVLVAQIEMYHWLHRQTDTVDDLVVARVDDDAVAAYEDGIEELVGVNRYDPRQKLPSVPLYGKAITIGGRV